MQASGGRAERVAGTLALRVAGVLLAATAVVVLVAPRDPNVVFSRPFVLAGFVGAGLVAALTVLVGSRLRPHPARVGWSWALAVAIAVGGAVVATSAARRVAYVVGWDAGVVSGFSETLHAGGRLTPYAVDYLSRYPNNIPLLALMNATRAVADRTGSTMAEVFVTLNGLCVAVVLLSTYALVRMVRSHRAAVCAQLVLLLLLGASPWLAVPYTDVVLMPFLTVGLLLAVAALRARRPAAMALLGLGSVAVLTLGFTVKATLAPTLVAVAVVALLVVLGRAGVRSLALGVAFALAAGLVYLGAGTLARSTAERVSGVDAAQLAPGRAPPLQWWIAMGLSKTPRGDGYFYGSYDGTMVRDSRYLGGAQLQAYSEQALRDRVDALGTAGLARFAVDKQAFNWGDGMFFAWGEGADATPSLLLRNDPTSRWVQSWNHVLGSAYLTRASLTTGVWLFVLAWAGVGLLGAGYRREVLLLALSVALLMGFTLLLQSRSRYLLAYLPVVVALAAVVDVRAVARLRRGPRTPHRIGAAEQSGHSPSISTVWRTWVKPCAAATASAQRSTASPVTSTARPHDRHTTWWWWSVEQER